MKFIVDSMLGKLSKWLRILGYDTIYDAGMSDEQLFFQAHLERRVLLTRDNELAGRMNPHNRLFIFSEEVREQVKQVLVTYHLEPGDKIFTRCTLCNSLVEPIEKELIQGKVPDYIYETVDEFVQCKTCHKIYWPGSHLKGVRKILHEIQETDSCRDKGGKS